MSRLPETGPSLTRWLRQQERLAGRQANSSSFARSGMSVSAEGVVTVAGAQQSADFDGDLAAGDAGTKGWALNAARAAFGALFLRPGSIENDSLTSPVTAQYVFDSLTNFALTTTFHSIRAKTITVPAGFTSAVVSVTARVMAINPNTTGGSNGAGADYLYAGTNIDGFNGNALPLSIGGSGGSSINVAPFSTTLTGLTAGSTFTITIDAGTAFLGWAANASNVGEVSGHILWFR